MLRSQKGPMIHISWEKKCVYQSFFFMYHLLPMLTFPDLESDYLKIIAGHGVDMVIWCLL